MEHVELLGEHVVWVHAKQEPQTHDGLRLQRACVFVRVGKPKQRVVLGSPRVHVGDTAYMIIFVLISIS